MIQCYLHVERDDDDDDHDDDDDDDDDDDEGIDVKFQTVNAYSDNMIPQSDGPLLLTWITFNPSMERWLHPS